MTNLTKTKKGMEYIVAGLDADNDENKMKKLMSIGILPGMPLKMIQSFPAYVIQVGYTQIAIDDNLASAINVRCAVCSGCNSNHH